ncbi:MAG: CBS domain-containing protein [Candidatus Micrarchaeota archaeon]|nr:CBS domain-containing protein [Candidatus Micrarchaeota archaeon]
MEEASFIGKERRRLGLTQHQLAKMAGVSQSLVAKVESGSVDAAYSKIKALLEALERASLSGERTAREIMHAGIKSVAPSDTLHAASAAMRKLSISQLPVVEAGRVVGSLTEASILACFSERKDIAKTRVSEVMDEAFPNVLPSTPISSVASLLRHHPAVLVLEKGEIAGIITKADILRAI